MRRYRLRSAWLNPPRNHRRSLGTVRVAALATDVILRFPGFGLFSCQSLAVDAARTAGHPIVAKPAHCRQEEDMSVVMLGIGIEPDSALAMKGPASR